MLLFIISILITFLGIAYYYFVGYDSYDAKNKKHNKLFLVLYNFCNKIDELFTNFWVLFVCIWVAGVMFFLFGISAFVIIYSGNPGELASKQAQYDVIMYQLESHMYTITDGYNNLLPTDAGEIITEDADGNEVHTGKVVIGYGQRELMNDVSEWNTELATHITMENNIWVGMFYPKWSDKLNFIDLNEVLG